MSIIRNKSICLVQNYQSGILSLLPNVLGNKRSYGLTCPTEVKTKQLMRRPSRLMKFARQLSNGVLSSPLGPCPKVPNQNLVEYIFKDVDQWMDETAAVSKTCNKWNVLAIIFLSAVLDPCSGHTL